MSKLPRTQTRNREDALVRSFLPAPALSWATIRHARRVRSSQLDPWPQRRVDSDPAPGLRFDAVRDFPLRAAAVSVGIAMALDLNAAGFLAWREDEAGRLLFASAGTDLPAYIGRSK